MLGVPADATLATYSVASLLAALDTVPGQLLERVVADMAAGTTEHSADVVTNVASSAIAGATHGAFDSAADTVVDVRVVPCGSALLLITLNRRSADGVRDQHLGALAQLARGIVHDINNTLNPVMAAAYLLDHHAESPEQVREYASRIRQAADAGAESVGRLGRFLRQKPLGNHESEAVDLTRLAGNVLDLTEPLLQQRAGGANAITVTRRLPSPVMVRGVQDDLRVAVLNVVMNAIDAMPAGGRLTLRVSVDRDGAKISVRDTGGGMSPAVQARLFEPFFTTKRSDALGLGLAEVYGILRRHGGHTRVESEEGGGSTITLRFPATDYLTAVAPETVTTVASNSLRILLVEDHDQGREFLRRALERVGYVVDLSSTCADALERLASMGNTQYDVVLTDVGLPDGSGWDVVVHARHCMPAVRIGVLTGWEADVDPNISAQADFLMRKPLGIAALLALIAGSPAVRTT